MKKIIILLVLVMVASFIYQQATAAYGPSKFYGPFNAEVHRVIDGDTIKVTAQIFPHIEAVLSVRLAGIDTPEVRTKKACEKVLGLAAKAFVEAKFPPDGNPWVLLKNVKDDKFSGRVVADVMLSKTVSLNQLLLDSGHAVVYTGKGARKVWC